jgi:tetratricopeptide (TPR) repeat protein
VWLAIAGAAKLWTGKDEEAITLLRRVIETNRNYPFAHFWLGATLANVGRTDEARAATQAGLALDPSFTVARHVAQSDNPIFPACRPRSSTCVPPKTRTTLTMKSSNKRERWMAQMLAELAACKSSDLLKGMK